MTESNTVASYLKTRLEELGLDRLFGVAGNYTAAFLDTILADDHSPITISGNPNELCAGYAADAYARLKGIGALYVTYSVGAFSLINTIAGSYTEQVPVVLINGAPTIKKIVSKKMQACYIPIQRDFNLSIFICLDRLPLRLKELPMPDRLPYQIDSALTALITHQKPVYFEISEDVWRAECIAPQGKLMSGADARIAVSEVDPAVAATIALIQSRPKSYFLGWG